MEYVYLRVISLFWEVSFFCDETLRALDAIVEVVRDKVIFLKNVSFKDDILSFVAGYEVTKLNESFYGQDAAEVLERVFKPATFLKEGGVRNQK